MNKGEIGHRTSLTQGLGNDGNVPSSFKIHFASCQLLKTDRVILEE